jgi:putative hydrolase of the HAD superfamily
LARSGGRRISTLLFDLDETLYRPETGLLRQIDRRIDQFLQIKLGLEESAVSELRYKYYRQYGTTLRGVKEVHGVDPEEYCAYTYHLDIREYIRPNPVLYETLMNIPAQKVVFSNSPRGYVRRVLQALQVHECVSDIFDIKFSNYLGKPNRLSYEMVLESLEVSGDECIFLDDQQVNLEPAQELGIITVQVGKKGKKNKAADYTIGVVEEIGDLWTEVTREELKKTGSDLL